MLIGVVGGDNRVNGLPSRQGALLIYDGVNADEKEDSTENQKP